MDANTRGVSFSENNSGGSWWLGEDDYRALMEEGWIVDWSGNRLGTSWGGRRAFLPGASMWQAEVSFQAATGQDPNERGCDCCGAPFWLDEERYGDLYWT